MPSPETQDVLDHARELFDGDRRRRECARAMQLASRAVQTHAQAIADASDTHRSDIADTYLTLYDELIEVGESTTLDDEGAAESLDTSKDMVGDAILEGDVAKMQRHGNDAEAQTRHAFGVEEIGAVACATDDSIRAVEKRLNLQAKARAADPASVSMNTAPPAEHIKACILFDGGHTDSDDSPSFTHSTPKSE